MTPMAEGGGILKYILLIKVVLKDSPDAKFTFQVVWT